MTAKRITILGSTGSIGKNTLDVIARHRDDYVIHALTANRSVDELAEQCQHWSPDYAVLVDAIAADELRTRLRAGGCDTEVLQGADALKQVASHEDVDVVVAGIVGAAGLLPTFAAAETGKRLLLANKEVLVMCGRLFMDTIHASGAELLPVDSEHNAIFQCIHADGREMLSSGVRKIILTASGGPFRTFSKDQLEHVSIEQTIAHPNWVMGPKISVDSASMMNKGLEVIEARWLFDMDIGDIDVVIHPQSVIHSMVSYDDGSVLAQLGNPDMRTPIAYSLAWPERIEAGVTPLDITEVSRLDFEAPDADRFPCLALSYQAIERGGTASIVLNAANEVAVAAFLDGQIGFTAIPVCIDSVLSTMSISDDVSSIDNILAADAEARRLSAEWLAQRKSA